MRVALAILCWAVGVGAQDAGAFVEVRRHRWASQVPSAAALSASGHLLAFALDGDTGQRLIVHELPGPAPARSVPVGGGTVHGLCFVDEGTVCVGQRDIRTGGRSWQRLRLEDGARVGEPQEDVPEQLRSLPRLPPEPADLEQARMRGGLRIAARTADRAVLFDRDSALWVWDAAGARPLTDGGCRAIAFTPSGRHVALLTTTQVQIVPVAGGDPQQPSIPGHRVLAVWPGLIADDLCLVTCDGVVFWNASANHEVRRSTARVDCTAIATAHSPRTAMLAACRADGTIAILDLATDSVCTFDCAARHLCWNGDGTLLWTFHDELGNKGRDVLRCWDRNGTLLDEQLLERPGRTLNDPPGAMHVTSAGPCLTFDRYEYRLTEESVSRVRGLGQLLAVLDDGRVVRGTTTRLALRAGLDGDLLAGLDVDRGQGVVAVDAQARHLAAVVGRDVVIWALPRAR